MYVQSANQTIYFQNALSLFAILIKINYLVTKVLLIKKIKDNP